MKNTPFSKKSNFKTGVINKLQIEKDDIDDETQKMLEQKSIEQLSNENDLITQEINKLNDELLDINEKSNNIEALLKSQQQCISLLNKDNEELREIADQAAQKLVGKSNGKHKKAKRIKESDLMSQIHSSIEIQDSLIKKSISAAKENPEIKKIEMIRKANLKSSSAKLSNFDQIIIKRQNLIDRYKEYSDEMINHTKRNKLFEEYDTLLQENKKLTEIYSKRNEQKQILEKKKKKLADIESYTEEIESMKEKIKSIDQEIENKKLYSIMSQIFQHDGQDIQDAQTTTQDEHSQISDSQNHSSIGIMTDGPIFNTLSDKDLKIKISQIKTEINDMKQQIDQERSEIMENMVVIRDQHKAVVQDGEIMQKSAK